MIWIKSNSRQLVPLHSSLQGIINCKVVKEGNQWPTEAPGSPLIAPPDCSAGREPLPLPFKISPDGKGKFSAVSIWIKISKKR